MQLNPTLRARIDDGGRVVWHGYEGKRWEAIKRFLTGAEVDITIGRHRKKTSPRQRRYYWAVIVAMIAEAAGYTPEEAHDALRRQFLTIHGDTALPTVRSTEDLTTTEREQYHEDCRRLGAETYGIYIPDPNEAAEFTDAEIRK
jgi:hypothetical protein